MAMQEFVISFLLIGSTLCLSTIEDPIQCVYNATGALAYTGTVEPLGNGSALCYPQFENGKYSHPSCMSLFTLVNTTDEFGNVTWTPEISTYGCWSNVQGSLDRCYTQAECTFKVNLEDKDNLEEPDIKFCCCAGNNCNHLSKLVRLEDEVTPTCIVTTTGTVENKQHTHLYIIFGLGGLAFLVAVSVLLFYCYRKHSLKKQLFRSQMEQYKYEMRLSNDPPVIDFDDLKLEWTINNGRFGEVFKAKLKDRDVCVKYFHPKQHDLFANEKDIYSVLDPTKTTVVNCLSCHERSVDGNLQYIVIMEFLPLGSLMSYFKMHTLNWKTMCQLAQTMANGLGYLHSETWINGTFKHAIVHRDVNSRNILVRQNMTCALVDMGFALKIRGSKFIKNGQEEHAEETSLRDVGTVRYMAPEILDGAVNLRDCEASLKQIDMYAVGLVLWELVTRCTDLRIGSHDVTKEYKLPYEEELGPHPSFAVMQTHVSKNKQRPTFPVNLKANEMTKLLIDTIEECWDNDAEARLTAYCVEERFKELSAMMENKHQPELSKNEMNDKHKPMRSSIEKIPLNASEITPLMAMDHPVLISDNISHMNTKPDVNVEIAQHRLLGPAQGRNVVADRNTHKESNEQLAVHNNTLMSMEECRLRQAAEDQRQKRISEGTAQRQQSDSNRQPSRPSQAPIQLDIHNEVLPMHGRKTKDSNLSIVGRRHNSQHDLSESSSGREDSGIEVDRRNRPKSLHVNLTAREN